MRIPALLLATLLTAACASTETTEPTSPTLSPDAQFTEIAEEAWYFNRKQNAFAAARMGYEEYADQLTDNSPEALRKRYETRKAYYEQLEAIDPETLTEENQINRDMLMYALRNQLSDYEFGMYLRPLTNEHGPQNAAARVASQTVIRNEQDMQNYIARLQQIPGWFEQQIAYMREGLETGMSQPRAVLENFAVGIESFATLDPRDSVFFAPVERASRYFSEEDYEAYNLEVQTLIATLVNPAYMDFHDFMVDEYIPNTREDIAATNLPNGEDFYKNRIRHYTTTDLTAEEIHQIGVREVERIRAEMEAVIEEVEFEGTFAEFIHFLRTDPQFYVDSGEQLLKEAAWIAKQADAVLPQLFYTLPRTPYGVAPVPEQLAPNYTQGRYSRSSGDDQAGYYWVNTYAVETRPLYELEALTLHEGVPGHHLQIALAQEMEDVPAYRNATYISAFGEGWGLYAEYLGLETGFYQDPYSNFGRLTYEMWRAARLVVDTGMHALGWTRDEAVEFLGSNTALSLHNVNTEIDRYISWPAQALSYKLGELKIRELRAYAEDQLGADFDLRGFHDEVLRNGSIPLATLEAIIHDWVDSQL